MSVTQTRRLVPSASLIIDASERAHYWEQLLRYWRLPPHVQHFPGANPMSIEETDLARLERDDFLVALKTDGVRYLLLLACKPNSLDAIALMIDRTCAMYEVEIWANEDFFRHGSLYDGELVWESGVLRFVVFDVVLAKGVYCGAMPYRERLEVLHNTILCASSAHHSDASLEQMVAEECKLLARNNDHQLSVVPKRCLPKANLQLLWDERGASGHRNDGLIFTANAAPVETGTSANILKWKPHHSVDLLLDAAKALFANRNRSGDLEPLAATLSDHAIRLVPNSLLAAVEPHLPCILEFVVRLVDGELQLFAERERTDKTAPNSVATIEATVRNVLEDISVADLLARVV